ncbi:FG-GAP-like repeat-containing protein [Streptomyces sp. NPDC051940]|uniref:FG-GAP-like repeat-containing protein n=1 Tax=Streptomyces sp. NPDC051940 TaxID=3155675 RepID=UPI0034397236
MHAVLLAFTVLASLLLPVGVARAEDPAPEDCAPLALAPFGDPGSAIATGSLQSEEAHCVTLTVSAGTHILRLSDSGNEVVASVDGLEGEQGCYASITTTGWCALNSGTYTVHIRNQGFGAQTYEFAVAPAAQTQGCAAISTRWDEPATSLQPAVAVQMDCRVFEGRSGERVDVIVAGGAERRVVDARGEGTCVRDGGDGCVLQGDGPYRVLSYTPGRDTPAYTLRLGSLSDPQGCVTLQSGTFGAPPVGPMSNQACRTLTVPAAGRYVVGTVSSGPNAFVDAPAVYDDDGSRLCLESGWCTFPGAGSYHLLMREAYFEQAGTVFIDAADATGCVPVAAGTYRGDIGSVGEYDCLELPMTTGATIAAVRDPDAPVRPVIEVVDRDGSAVCAQEGLSKGTCALTGTAPYRLIAHGGAGEYGLYLVRTDSPAGCQELPAGSFADGSPHATLATGDGVFAGCGTIAADQHTASEVVQFQQVAGTARMSLSVIDSDGKQVCEHFGGTNGWVGCRLTPGKAHIVLYQARNQAASYEITRRDITATAQGCAQTPATTVGGPSTKGASSGATTLRCHQVTTGSTADSLHLDVRDANGTTNLIVFDADGQMECGFRNRACAARGSTSYQVLTQVPAGLAMPAEYRLDAWRFAGAEGFAPECKRVASVAYGYGPVTGTLTETHTADCAVLPTAWSDRFIPTITDTAGGMYTAAPHLYTDNGGIWKDGCVDSYPPCGVLSGSTETVPSLFVLGLPEKASQTSYRAQLACDRGVCGGESFKPTSFSPTAAATGTTVTVTVKGTALKADMRVRLTGNGTTIEAATTSASADWTTLTSTFDLRGVAVGGYTLSVTGTSSYLLGTFSVTQQALTNLAKPTVKGPALVGATLTATTGSWPDGPTSFTYQWNANGTAITGATSAAYRVPASMRGKSLTVAVTAHKSGWTSATATSSAVTISAARRDHVGSDGVGDLLSLSSTGAFSFHKGGGFTSKVSGAVWSTSLVAVPFGDVNGDRCNDVLVRFSSGTLRAYKPACGQALGSSTPYTSLGTGWELYNALTSPGDMTGDGRADLLARGAKTGTLYLFPGTSGGKLGARKTVRTSWSGFTHIVGAGDLNGDGIGDVLARSTTGKLYRCYGRADGTLGSGVVLWSDWGASYKEVIGVGDITGDGKADLVVRDKYGNLYRNAGNGNGTFGGRVKVATGWQGYKAVY